MTQKVTILLEGHSSYEYAKTAIGIIRYSSEQVVSLIDSKRAGVRAADIFNVGDSIPFVASVEDALSLNPELTTMYIGVAPVGGKLPSEMRPFIRSAIKRGLDVIAGLHDFLNEDPELSSLAQDRGVKLVDVRNMGPQRYMSYYSPHRKGTMTVLTVGTDGSVGKMTTSLEIHREAQKRGINSMVAATGQTGIMILKHGIPVDRTFVDFANGYIATYVSDLSKKHDLILVEGQGKITHGPATLALMQGSDPDALILCHEYGRTHIKGYDVWPIPSLERHVEIYEQASSWIRTEGFARVVGISLNTRRLPEAEAKEAIREAQSRTNVVTTDPVRFGPGPLLDSILSYRDKILGDHRSDSSSPREFIAAP